MIKNYVAEIVCVLFTAFISFLFVDVRGVRKNCMQKDQHDELCRLKLKPLADDVAEIKNDIAEIKDDIKGILDRIPYQN